MAVYADEQWNGSEYNENSVPQFNWVKSYLNELELKGNEHLSNLEDLLKNAESNGTSLYRILELRKNMSGIYFNLLDYKRTLEMLEWFAIHKDRLTVEQMNEEQKNDVSTFFRTNF